MKLSENELLSLKTREDLTNIFKTKGLNYQKYLDNLGYLSELLELQAQLLILQQWVKENGKRVVVIFEGRDASGKGGAIKRFAEHLNPRYVRIVALNKPTTKERGQWYFQRYVKQLPSPGEITLFDRSWYNRAVVEPVMGFCDKTQYNEFILQVPEFEHMLFENKIHLIKLWFSVSKDEQEKRFKARIASKLKAWKYSDVDQQGQDLWADYTYYKEKMFLKSHTPFAPWTVVKTNNKKTARLESIKHLLSCFDYHDKSNSLPQKYLPDPNVIRRYYRNSDH